MQSQDLARDVSSQLTVRSTQPTDSTDQSIWIRIPTSIVRTRNSDDPEPMAHTTPRVETTTRSPSDMAPTFRRAGHSREIQFAGLGVTLRDMQGFRIYASLLARPHVRITAVELRAGIAGVDKTLFAGSTGPMASVQSIAELRNSFEILSEELAEAEEHHDLAREQRLRAELDALADHLRQVVGKNGQPRQQSDAERARVAVCKALNRARRVIKQEHPTLHAHLERTVTSGTVLIYRPDASIAWMT